MKEDSQKIFDEMKAVLQKENKEVTDREVQESVDWMERYVSLIYDCAKSDQARKQKLKENPEGFPVDGNYSCQICGNSINPDTGWYDKYGPKCSCCRRAVDTGAVPGFVCVNHDSYYSMWRIKDAYKTNVSKVKKWIKEEKLIPRLVLDDNGNVHCYIFLKKENPHVVLEKWNPIRKSYDRAQKKRSNRWAREASDSLKKELKIGKYRKKTF